MMITNTMTRTNKKRTRRSSVVAAHRSSTRCWPRRGIVTPLDGVPDQLGQKSSMPRQTAAWRAGAGTTALPS